MPRLELTPEDLPPTPVLDWIVDRRPETRLVVQEWAAEWMTRAHPEWLARAWAEDFEDMQLSTAFIEAPESATERSEAATEGVQSGTETTYKQTSTEESDDEEDA